MQKNAINNGENVALLVIDVQKGLFHRAHPIYKAEELLKNINNLVDRSHENGVPVYYIQHANASSLVEGSEAWELHPEIQPEDGDAIIHKRSGSAFQDTPLREELAGNGVGKIVVTGLVTHGCVRATCLDALRLSYQVVLVEDGHSNFNKNAAKYIKKWNKVLQRNGVELFMAEEVQFP
jgi:nicotinamidase-related amidase